MNEMVDYSGPYDAQFNLEKLSRETLLKLLRMYAEYIRRVDGHWYLSVMKKWGNDEALDCDLKVWQKVQVFEEEQVSSLLNIHGDDVVTVMKAIQASPWMGIYDYSMEIGGKDHAILTFKTCPTLFAIEREGTGREKSICQIMEPMALGIIAHFFNPDIKVIPLQVPPRTDRDGICCRWAFRLDR